MNPNPPPLRELCAKATPGPWFADAVMEANHALEICLAYDIPEAGSPVIIASVFDDEDDGGPIALKQAEANAQLIARLSPEVMLAVYEALTLVDLDFTRMNYGNPEFMGDDEFEAWRAVNKSLRLLDGLGGAT